MSTTDNNDINNRSNSLSDSLNEALKPISTLISGFNSMIKYSDDLNKNFTLSRSRIQEMNLAFTESSVEVLKLGGSLSNTVTTITEIADASNRNVIENKKVVAELYASSKILGLSAEVLVNNFKDVGYETSQIGPNLEKSITYVQSVGLNARTVMQSVSTNMEQMNRFQFEGGVAGLTKMAAQSSMLRFEMSQTFGFADRMLKPENAINMAAAFQRLGVTAGNLIDPFALMNQSLIDPTGLNNSLARLGEKFVYFSEEAQAFKINPEGVRILKELEDEAGLLPGSLAKSALAAADLDKRLSQVSAAGLKFENEEDKQYLANIAAMGKGGKYEVTLEDGTKKDLQSLNQEEFDKLIKQQKDSPKTIEEIQRSQLGYAGTMAADIASILGLLKFALPKQEKVRTNIEGFKKVMDSITNTARKKITAEDKDLGKLINDGIIEAAKLFDKASTGDLSVTDLMSQFGSIQEKIMSNAGSLGDKAMTSLKEILKESASQVKGTSYVEQKFRDAMGIVSSGVSASGAKSGTQTQIKTNQVAPVSKNAIMGTKNTLKNYSESPTPTNTGISGPIQIGPFNIGNVGTPQKQKQLKDELESPEIQRQLVEIFDKVLKKIERTK